jgi:hypothetical protein
MTSRHGVNRSVPLGPSCRLLVFTRGGPNLILLARCSMKEGGTLIDFEVLLPLRKSETKETFLPTVETPNTTLNKKTDVIQSNVRAKMRRSSFGRITKPRNHKASKSGEFCIAFGKNSCRSLAHQTCPAVPVL